VILQRNWISGVALILLLSLPALLAHAQTQNSSLPVQTQPAYSPGPITDYKAALPNFDEVLQFRRGARYDHIYSDAPELGEDSEVEWALPSSHFKKQPTPFDASDAVIVGTVTAGQSHLSNDRRDIYSEFQLTLHEVLDNSAPPYLRQGDSIDVQRKGGGIKLPSGKILTRSSMAYSMPQVACRYLLFLKYDQSTEDYSVLNAYQLTSDEVYRLDQLSPADNHLHINGPLPKVGANESEFLARVKSPQHSSKASSN
jgi:hypothetical protein